MTKKERIAAASRARARQWKLDNPNRKRPTQEEMEERARLRPLRKIFLAGYWGVKTRGAVLDYPLITFEEWVMLVNMFDGMCSYCGIVPPKLTMDHIIPISKGGRHVMENITPSCLSCNNSKGATDAQQFRRKRLKAN